MTRKVIYLHVKKPIEFLKELIKLMPEQSYISFEGDLSHASRVEFDNVIYDPIGKMDKQSSQVDGRHDFMILPLSTVNKDKLTEQFVHVVGMRKNVWHVLIEFNNALVFGAYDNFHEECTLVDYEIGKNMNLEEMKEKKIIASYRDDGVDF